SYVGGAGANSGKDFTGKARNTDFQAFQIVQTFDFFAEPTAHLHTGVTAGSRDQVVRLIHVLPQLHAAAVVEPAVLFGGGHTKRTGGQELGVFILALPVIGSGVAQVVLAGTHHIKHAHGGFVLIGSIDFNFKTAVRQFFGQLGHVAGGCTEHP